MMVYIVCYSKDIYLTAVFDGQTTVFETKDNFT